jgi:lipopolysaccharide transport protein LptA
MTTNLSPLCLKQRAWKGIFAIFIGVSSVALAAPSPEKKDNPFVSPDFNKAPTFISSQALTLQTQARLFTYSGSVEVKHGDMTLTADKLEGTYDEQNKIQRLIASNNVIILKGSDIRATSNSAIYEATNEIVTLTQNPELTQNGSLLSADKITLFLREDRSEASGQVRVKLLPKEGGDNGASNLLPR